MTLGKDRSCRGRLNVLLFFETLVVGEFETSCTFPTR
jgi:hypothetical protein